MQTLQEQFQNVKLEIEKEFDLELPEVACSVSSEGLSIWEAACCWTHDDGSTLIQLSPRLEKGTFLGYTSCEIIRHELVHAARVFEKGDRFEELLACTVGSAQRKSFRRFLPALFYSQKEVWIFMLIFLISWSMGIFFAENFFELALFLIPVMLPLVFCIVRLFRNWHILKCVMQITPLSRLIRMSQEEILQAYNRLL